MRSLEDRIRFLGCPVDSLDRQALLRTVAEWVVLRVPRRITVLNANKLWQMSHDMRLWRVVVESDLIIPEWSVVWGAARLGLRGLHFLPGIEIVREILRHAEQTGISVYFLGAREQPLSRMIISIKEAYPLLRISGWHHGYLASAQLLRDALEDIRIAHPDILFVGMGSPRQEYFIAEHQKNLNVPAAMGVGGSFDVLSGDKRDTPDWARGRGLEWLYRLAQEPRAYWKRYLITNPWIVYQVMKARILGK